MHRVIRTSCAILLLLCAGSQPKANPLKDLANRISSAKKEFPVQESGYWTCERGRGPCIYWLDNDRVIFNGSRPNDLETLPDGRRVSKHAIYVWDLKTGNVTKHADAERATLCYAGGYVSYSRKEPPYIVNIGGSFGKEAEISRVNEKQRAGSKGTEMTRLNHFTCKSYRQSEISPLPGIRLPLKAGDGFLYVGVLYPREERLKPVIYFPEGNQRGIELPIARWQVSLSDITATDFDNSYLLTGDQLGDSSNRCVPKGFSRRVHRLRTSGDVETISLPARDELRCYVEVGGVREVRKGITVYINTGQSRSSRLYLVEGEQLKELARGWVPEAQVSPDGCRMAAGISSDDDPLKPTAPSYRGHLKVIEFCAKGGK